MFMGFIDGNCAYWANRMNVIAFEVSPRLAVLPCKCLPALKPQF